MKQSILLTVIFHTALVATAQLNSGRQTANYEAASWKTVLLSNSRQITIAPAPSATQTKIELQALKQYSSHLDDKKRDAIKYWDAGAPSYRWNQLAPKLMSYDKVDVLMRTPMAWMNLAIYDATILAWKEKLKNKRKRPVEIDPSIKTLVITPNTYSYPCEHTVTAAAAATVLAYFFPEKADSIIQLAKAASQSRIDAGVQFPSDVEAGWKMGEDVAKEIIAQAKQDGSNTVWDGKMNKDPKKWTGPFPMGITLTKFKPMILNSAEQFRPASPPDFAADMKDLSSFKQTFKSKSLAYIWANNGPELWNDIASQKLFEYRMMDDAPAAARVYSVLNIAFHDATIAIMDAKYAYWGIRPVQYDTTYKSLITTPPFPGYPSGHAAGAGTSCAVMEYFFPADAKQFQQMAQDCADSRFYAGIHFKSDNEVGLLMGKQLGTYVVDKWIKQ